MWPRPGHAHEAKRLRRIPVKDEWAGSTPVVGARGNQWFNSTLRKQAGCDCSALSQVV